MCLSTTALSSWKRKKSTWRVDFCKKRWRGGWLLSWEVLYDSLWMPSCLVDACVHVWYFLMVNFTYMLHTCPPDGLYDNFFPFEHEHMYVHPWHCMSCYDNTGLDIPNFNNGIPSVHTVHGWYVQWHSQASSVTRAQAPRGSFPRKVSGLRCFEVHFGASRGIF